ncbi:MAG: cbb3-type cytochrome oxidase subunit 3 [Burkholderiaceae bacterium]|jgi:cytochrome c oxidase cbb3-type subunit 4
MVAILNAIATVVALMTFLGIVWWAFSRGRAQANDEAAMLPFELPDEGQVAKREGGYRE